MWETVIGDIKFQIQGVCKTDAVLVQIFYFTH